MTIRNIQEDAMLRFVMTVVLIAAGGLAFAQQTTNTNAAVTPVAVPEAKKYPEPVKISGITRMHYDLSFVSNGNQQKWGNFNFWYLTLKAQADLAENLKAETSIDMGYFSGQRSSTNGMTAAAQQLQIEKLIETAYLQYKVDTALVVTAGRFWEYYAPWIYSQRTRDGLGISGSVFDGMLKYGVQVFNDPVLCSVYMPLIEAQIGTMPMKGLSLDVATYFAGNPATNLNILQNGYSVNLKVAKWSVLPELFLMDEFVYNTVRTTASTSNSFNNFVTLGWQIGTVLPFGEFYISDGNLDANSTNDVNMQARLAVKWDINPNLSVVPYVIYDILKGNAAPNEPFSIRLRADCKF